jgi:hypothetical protein
MNILRGSVRLLIDSPMHMHISFLYRNDAKIGNGEKRIYMYTHLD